MEIEMGNEFAPPRSIVRTIWGDPHMVLLIFAGSAAEFALNRAVDWLFVTGSIPTDPLGLIDFTTVYVSGNDENSIRKINCLTCTMRKGT
jgi:hypothetical protein